VPQEVHWLRVRVFPMILENGAIRTMDTSLPLARALAIAGERIAGGVGTHERALASPERVDLGGRCVLPGFNDSHVHFPQWALAQRQIRLKGRSHARGGRRARRRGREDGDAGSLAPRHRLAEC